MIKKIIPGLFIICCIACHNEPSASELKLWYDRPARSWNEALPVGNGRLGAMVFGVPGKEQLQLNEETIWSGGPNNNTNPEIREVLPQVRDLIFSGKYAEAEELAVEKVISPNSGMKYQPAGNLWISFPGHENAEGYYRDLDIEKAVATVKYTVDGTEYTREIFASFTDQVLIVRLTAGGKGKINCLIGLDSPLEHELGIRDRVIELSGKTDDHEGQEGRVRFVILVQPVVEGGTASVSDSAVSIRGADAATVYVSIGTNFVNYHDISGDPRARAEGFLDRALAREYPSLLRDHISAYREYYPRVRLDLGTTEASLQPTDTRLREFGSGDDPDLVTLYFQFGRYLLISSSMPGTQPPTLQGIWNDRVSPPWDSKYTVNINAEMNYWPAEPANLSQLHEPFLKLAQEVSETGRETAGDLYGARGWVLHHNTDIWRVTGPVDRARSGLWPTGGAWLCQHVWEHYLYTGDKAFLQEYYPVLKGASEFFLDILQPEPGHGWLVVVPSISPENKFLDIAHVCAGATMDNQLLFDLFSHTAMAAGILGVDSQFSDTLEMVRSRLAPMQIGQYSQLQEWMHDWDDPEDHHRHVSHLYGLAPGHQISPYRNPLLFQAARNSLEYRGDESTGWSMGWKVNLWARLLDGNHAYKLITDQLTPAIRPDGSVRGGTFLNLLDAHPPFQIDGNFGCTAGIAEMLLQSHDGCVFILPALPDRWMEGEVTGLMARGGFELDISWSGGRLSRLTVHSQLGGNCRIRVWDRVKPLNKTDLAAASGPNPNPFYRVITVKDPLISEKASIEEPVLGETFLYDFMTDPGETYTFIPVEN